MPKIVVSFSLSLILSGLLFSYRVANSQTDPHLVLEKQWEEPVITTKTPGAEGNKYGFQGGVVLKVGGVYQLFTSEMVADPISVKMKLGHWKSTDRVNWTRVSTLFESSGEFTGKDPAQGELERAALATGKSAIVAQAPSTLAQKLGGNTALLIAGMVILAGIALWRK